MHLDPVMPTLVAVLFVILSFGLLMRLLRQPHAVSYLVAGVILGPGGLGLVTDRNLLDRLGAFGVVLLLFFIGMEVSPKELVRSWKTSLAGTAAQIAATVGVVWLLGVYFQWPTARVLLLGFAGSLSSTAIALGYLKDRGRLNEPVGRHVLSVLLVQDIALVPMLIVVAAMVGDGVEAHTMIRQCVGAAFMVAILFWLTFSDHVRLPLGRRIRQDHELQVFVAFILCFGLATMTAFFELSSALGAFLGGMVVGTARESDWVHHRLESFRVVFVALFFVSIGLLIDLESLRLHGVRIALLVVTVLWVNTLINTLMLRGLGESWQTALFGGALLSQIGELSFVLAATGHQSKLITDAGYQIAVAVIAISLMVSPAWISLVERLPLPRAERMDQGGASAGDSTAG